MASQVIFGEWALDQGFTNGGAVKARLENCQVGLARIEHLQKQALDIINGALATEHGDLYAPDESKIRLIVNEVGPVLDQVDTCLFKAGLPQLDEVAKEPHENATTALKGLVQKHNNYKMALRRLDDKRAALKSAVPAAAAGPSNQPPAPTVFSRGSEPTLPTFDGDKFNYRSWRAGFLKAQTNLGITDGQAFDFLLRGGLNHKVKMWVKDAIKRKETKDEAFVILDEEFDSMMVCNRDIDKRIKDLPKANCVRTGSEFTHKLDSIVDHIGTLDESYEGSVHLKPSDTLLTREVVYLIHSKLGMDFRATVNEVMESHTTSSPLEALTALAVALRKRLLKLKWQKTHYPEVDTSEQPQKQQHIKKEKQQVQVKKVTEKPAKSEPPKKGKGGGPRPTECAACGSKEHWTMDTVCKKNRGQTGESRAEFAASIGFCPRCIKKKDDCKRQECRGWRWHKFKNEYVRSDCMEEDQCTFNGKPVNAGICKHAPPPPKASRPPMPADPTDEGAAE